MPFSCRAASTAPAMVDFPDPERPVNHTTSDRCPVSVRRFFLSTPYCCQIRFRGSDTASPWCGSDTASPWCRWCPCAWHCNRRVRSVCAEAPVRRADRGAMVETETNTLLQRVREVLVGYPSVQAAYLFGSHARG